ncbi:hypothetical protein FF38_11585, partial [Lucilia cuprina]
RAPHRGRADRAVLLLRQGSARDHRPSLGDRGAPRHREPAGAAPPALPRQDPAAAQDGGAHRIGRVDDVAVRPHREPARAPQQADGADRTGGPLRRAPRGREAAVGGDLDRTCGGAPDLRNVGGEQAPLRVEALARGGGRAGARSPVGGEGAEHDVGPGERALQRRPGAVGVGRVGEEAGAGDRHRLAARVEIRRLRHGDGRGRGGLRHGAGRVDDGERREGRVDRAAGGPRAHAEAGTVGRRRAAHD